MGKKNPARNSFYYFMLDFKSKTGRRYANMAEVADAAGQHWQNMNAEQRKPYEDQARLEKNNQKVAKYTSAGIKLDVIQKQQNEAITKEMNMRDHIARTIRNAAAGGILADQPFYIVHINHFCFCNSTNQYIPAEVAVCKFNLRNGVTPENVFHEIVKPGPIPLGYTFDARKQSEETHQLLLPDNDDPDNLDEVLRKLIKFIKEDSPAKAPMPPLYTVEKNRGIAENILKNLCIRYCHDDNLFEIYSLEYMFFVLRNTVNENRPYPTISSSQLELDKDVYDFCKDIPCSVHQVSDVRNYCSRSYAIRLAYIICDNCCGDLEIDLIPGQHIPIDSLLRTSRPVSRASGSGWSRSEVTDNETYYSETCESEAAKSEVDTYSIPDTRDDYDDSDGSQETEWTEARYKNKRTTRHPPNSRSYANSAHAYKTDVQTKVPKPTFNLPPKQTRNPSPMQMLNRLPMPTVNPVTKPASNLSSNTASGSASESSLTKNKRTPVPNRLPYTLSAGLTGVIPKSSSSSNSQGQSNGGPSQNSLDESFASVASEVNTSFENLSVKSSPSKRGALRSGRGRGEWLKNLNM